MNDFEFVEKCKEVIDLREVNRTNCTTCRHHLAKRGESGRMTYQCTLLDSTLGVTFEVNEEWVCDRHEERR